MPKRPPKSPSPVSHGNGSRTKKSRSGIPGWFLNGLLLLGSVTICGVILELAARWMRPGPPPPDRAENLFQVEPVANPKMVYRILPDSRFVTFGVKYPTNELGFRDDAIREKGETHFRILCVGDSVTFGTGVKNEETFPNQLEAMLQEAAAEGWTADVVNAGVSAYNARNVLGLLETHLTNLQPDVVVYTFVQNDLDDSLSAGPDGYLLYHDPSKPPDEPYIQREFPIIWWGSKQAASPPQSALFQLLGRLVPEVPDDALPLLVGEHPETVRRWAAFSDTLQAMGEISRSAGAEFAVYSFAARNHSEPATRKVVEICRELDVPHGSTLPIFDKKTYMKEHSLGYDAHCNPLGNRMMAERLRDLLIEEDLLPEAVFDDLPSPPSRLDEVDDAIADEIENRALAAPRRIDLETGKGIQGALGGLDPVGRMARSFLFRLGPPGGTLEVEIKGLVTALGREQRVLAKVEGATIETTHTLPTDWTTVQFPIPESFRNRPVEVELTVDGPAWIPTPVERRQGRYPFTAAVRRVERK